MATAHNRLRRPDGTEGTSFLEEEEALIVVFRKHTLLPLDDCLYALQAAIPHLTRSSLHRCLQRHDISRLPETEGDKPSKKKFKAYPIGYFHIDIAEVRTEEGKLYLFVAIDRTSKFTYTELHGKAIRQPAMGDVFGQILDRDVVAHTADIGLRQNKLVEWNEPRVAQHELGLCFRHDGYLHDGRPRASLSTSNPSRSTASNLSLGPRISLRARILRKSRQGRTPVRSETRHGARAEPTARPAQRATSEFAVDLCVWLGRIILKNRRLWVESVYVAFVNHASY